MTSHPASVADGHLVAVGDVYVDIVVDLEQVSPALSFAELTSSSNGFGDLPRHAGGSALQVARAARESGLFAQATCIGAIGGSAGGPDGDGCRLLDVARRWGVSLQVAYIPATSTGEVLAVYDGTGARLMVSCPGANAMLRPDLLDDRMLAAAATATVLHVSGYTLLQADRWAAVKKLAAATRGAGGTVAVDLSPHDIDGIVDPRAVVASLEGMVDCLIVDLALLRRLAAAHGEDVVRDEPLFDWGTSRFHRLVVFPSPSHVLVVTAGVPHVELNVPYRSGVASRGQSAAVQASVLGMLGG